MHLNDGLNIHKQKCASYSSSKLVVSKQNTFNAKDNLVNILG